MRSYLYPAAQPHSIPSFNPMDLNISLDSADSEITTEWENWGEESTIELTEVLLKSDGYQMGMFYMKWQNFPSLNVSGIMTSPLPPIPQPRSGLVQLQFICTLPSMRDSGQVNKNKQIPDVSDIIDSSKVYLAASFCNVEIGDCALTVRHP